MCVLARLQGVGEAECRKPELDTDTHIHTLTHSHSLPDRSTVKHRNTLRQVITAIQTNHRHTKPYLDSDTASGTPREQGPDCLCDQPRLDTDKLLVWTHTHLSRSCGSPRPGPAGA